jgi:hypothetical protein
VTKKGFVFMILTKSELLKKIDTAFPSRDMPVLAELSFHKEGCHQCDDLREDVEFYRGKSIGGETIRLVHQEMSQLSAKAWQWILPFYIKYCLTDKGEYSRMETEFLIYSLSPAQKFELETSERLSLLTFDQINVVICFFELCLKQDHWRDLFSDDIDQAINYLKKIQKKAM